MTGSSHTEPQGGFPHSWRATILKGRPLILPRRRYVYPREAEEVERGALELLIEPDEADAFLATCALGFADPVAPTGLWSCPSPDQLCALAGGYAYLIDTLQPECFEQVDYRPVLAVHAVHDPQLLLFAGSYAIVAYGNGSRTWESPRLSDEGVTVRSIENGLIYGAGWQMRTDQESPFALDLKDGRLIHFSGKS